MSIESQYIPAEREIRTELDISEELQNLNTDIESHFWEQIPNVDLETVLKSIFSPLHRVFIHTVDNLPNEAKSTWIIIWQSSDFVVIWRAEWYEYQEWVSFEYKDSEWNKVPYDHTNPDLKIEQEWWVKTQRVAFITNIYVTPETPLSSLPIILREVESSFQQTYDEQWNEVVPDSLQKVLWKESIDDLWLSLWNTETLKKTYTEQIERIHRILWSKKYQIESTDSPEKKNLIQWIRKNLSKKAFFLFCMIRLVSWEDIYKKYTPQQLSQKYENYLQSLDTKNTWDDRNIHLDSKEIQVHSWPFQNEAQEFLETFDWETLNTNYLEAFIAWVKQFIWWLKITQKQKDHVISYLLFPQIQNWESYHEYSARAILEIWKIVDIYFLNTEFEWEINISEEALNTILQDQIVDDTMDTFMNLSLKEQIREWDLFQVISENFSPKWIDKILREVYIWTPEDHDIYNWYLDWIWVTYRFENIEETKQQLSDIKEKLEKSDSKEERGKLEQHLQTLQFDIAMLVWLIIYSNEFYRYHWGNASNFENTWEAQFHNRLNMCFWQWGQVHKILKWVFWIETQATWFVTENEKFSHFVTLIWKNQDMRTDWHSAFNPNQNRFVDRGEGSKWGAMFWDTSSTLLASNYIVYSQNKNDALTLATHVWAKNQLWWEMGILNNIWSTMYNLWAKNQWIEVQTNATRLIQSNTRLTMSIQSYRNLIVNLYNEKRYSEIPEQLKSMSNFTEQKFESNLDSISEEDLQEAIDKIIEVLSFWALLFYAPEKFDSENERTEYLSRNKWRVTSKLDLLVSKWYWEQVRKWVEKLLSDTRFLDAFPKWNQEITRNLLIPYLKLY